MHVVTFDSSRHNTVFVGETRYFVFSSQGRRFLVHDRCPHRGGPLSLGTVSADGRHLTCPWHGTRMACAVLRRKSVPLVRRGDVVTAYLPASEHGEDRVSVGSRQVLARDPGAAPARAAPAGVRGRGGRRQQLVTAGRGEGSRT